MHPSRCDCCTFSYGISEGQTCEDLGAKPQLFFPGEATPYKMVANQCIVSIEGGFPGLGSIVNTNVDML